MENYSYLIFMFLGIFVIFCFIAWLINCFSFYKLLEMSGEDGWKAFIPIYNQYVESKLFWNINGFYLYLISICIPFFIGMLSVPFPFLEPLINIGNILMFITTILFYINVGKSFDKSTAFIVGLVFFPFIFLLVLAFSKNTKYNGKSNKKEEPHDNYYENDNNMYNNAYNNNQQNYMNNGQQANNQQQFHQQQRYNQNQCYYQDQQMNNFQQEQQNQNTLNQMNLQNMQQQQNNNLF